MGRSKDKNESAHVRHHGRYHHVTSKPCLEKSNTPLCRVFPLGNIHIQGCTANNLAYRPFFLTHLHPTAILVRNSGVLCHQRFTWLLPGERESRERRERTRRRNLFGPYRPNTFHTCHWETGKAECVYKESRKTCLNWISPRATGPFAMRTQKKE